MMINPWSLLLARCCCISMLLLSLAFTTSNATPTKQPVLSLKPTASSPTNSQPAAGADNERYLLLSSISAKKPRPKRVPQEKHYTQDDCLSGHPRLPAPEGPVLVSRRQGQWRCEFKIHIALPDTGHLIQLNFTTFQTPVDMRDYSAQQELQLQENNNTYTTATTTTTTSITGSAASTYNGGNNNNSNNNKATSPTLTEKGDGKVNVISSSSLSSSSSSQSRKLQQQRTSRPHLNNDPLKTGNNSG